jgi:hypothetical protein
MSIFRGIYTVWEWIMLLAMMIIIVTVEIVFGGM